MQQLDLTQDGGKQVVEIVRYARRHLADGAQLLRVQQLRVQPPRLGDLGVDVDAPDHLADQTAHRRRVALDDARRVGCQLPFALVDLSRPRDQLA